MRKITAKVPTIPQSEKVLEEYGCEPHAIQMGRKWLMHVYREGADIKMTWETWKHEEYESKAAALAAAAKWCKENLKVKS